jgi:hypothetical protein
MHEQLPTEINEYDDTPLNRDEILRVLNKLGIVPPEDEWQVLSDHEILEYLMHLSGYLEMSVEETFVAVGIKVADVTTEGSNEI